MGAEPWSAIVPYQADVGAALKAARAEEFAAGRYRIVDPDNPPATIEEAFSKPASAGRAPSWTCTGSSNARHEVVNGRGWRGLDDYRNLCMTAPLSSDQLARLYGDQKRVESMVLTDTDGRARPRDRCLRRHRDGSGVTPSWFYLDGDLYLMSPAYLHENVAGRLGDLVKVVTEELDHSLQGRATPRPSAAA